MGSEAEKPAYLPILLSWCIFLGALIPEWVMPETLLYLRQLDAAPGMQDLIKKCSLAARHLYKSEITLKGGQYIIFIIIIHGETKPLEVAWVGQNQTWVCLYWIRPVSSRQKYYHWLNHQTHHKKVQENPHCMCWQICLFTIVYGAEVRLMQLVS